QAHGFEAAPDLGHVLDLDPVELDVLTVRDVGGAAGEVVRDVRDRPQLFGGEFAAVDADAHHQILVLELMGLEGRRATAVDSGFALSVQAPPAETSVKIIGGDRGESALGVDVLDPVADIEAVVLGLIDLIFVQRFTAVDLPLPIGLLRPLRSLGGLVTCGLLVRFHLSGHGHLQTLRGTSGTSRYKRIDCSTNSRLQQCHSSSYDVTEVAQRASSSRSRTISPSPAGTAWARVPRGSGVEAPGSAAGRPAGLAVG